jgi:hypothetical protein
MPPRAVWKIRPSGVVPYLLMWARSSFTSSGGMGMVRVSWSARCFRPRSCRAVPWSVQAVPAWEAEAARTILPHPFLGRCRSLSRSITASDGRSAAKYRQA